MSEPRTPAEELTTKAIEGVIDQIYSGKNPEQIRQSMQDAGIDKSLADGFMALAALAGTAALEIKKGKPFNQVVDEMKLTPQLRPLGEKILKAAYEKVKDRPDTVAGNPARVKVQIKPFILTNLAGFLALGIPVFAMCGLITLLDGIWIKISIGLAIFFSVLLVLVLKLLWTATKRRCRFGNVCPGIVVSLNPYRIAVLGNLSKGGGPAYDVIKIIDDSPARPNILNKVDDRLATIATYQDAGKRHHWSDFLPEPVYCATHDLDVADQVRRSISESEWIDLAHGLTQVPDKSKIGLYKISLTNSKS